ncbi:PilZ domain-containing protein [Agaribacterium sp. ZY112]|uniref:PilZ domain-containing protein n=1 Tax=Agaribacterium sp. ZY112 TaxID=3233574 RepID=UPI0035261647
MSASNQSYHEKRGFIRMKIDSPIKLIFDDGQAPQMGICKDLSGGGLLVETETTLPVGTSLEVIISSDHGHSPILRAHTHVSRIISKPSSEQLSCLLGLKIDTVLD